MQLITLQSYMQHIPNSMLLLASGFLICYLPYDYIILLAKIY